MLCVCCTIVVEQFVICAKFFIYFVHVFLYNCWQCIIVGVTCFSCLEEDIRVLSRTSLAWMIWIQSIFTECIDNVHICHIFQIFIIPCFNFLNFMRSTETVKEVNKRNFTFQSCQMCNWCQVHNFLYRRFAKHCTSCLATCIYVGMIAENRKCMACKCTSRYVEYTW